MGLDAVRDAVGGCSWEAVGNAVGGMLLEMFLRSSWGFDKIDIELESGFIGGDAVRCFRDALGNAF